MLSPACALIAIALTCAAAHVEQQPITEPSLIAKFQAKVVRTPTSYRARRRLQAENLRFKIGRAHV